MKTMESKASTFQLARLFLAAVVFCATAAYAEFGERKAIKPGATIDGLRMEARASVAEENGEKLLSIRAYLINEGAKDATVLTKELGPSMSQDAKGPVVGFDYTARQKVNGRLIIPSLHSNEPVTLRPGEVAMLDARMPSTLREGEKIRVGYLVLDTWGERFDIWHGYVCAVVPVEGMPSR